MKQEVLLEIKDLNKSFGPTRANRNVSLTLCRGEIRGIAGENGCGKSTLMSILTGMQPKDSGEIYLNGELYEPKDLLYANQMGISMVVQELGLLEQLPGDLNMFFGHTKQFSTCGLISVRRLRKRVREELARWGLDYVDTGKLAAVLSVEERKLIELARALSVDPQIIILDELTQALSLNSRKALYEILKKLRSMGKAVFVITHDLEEMLQITDTVTVMRDGEIVETCRSDEVTEDELRYKMIGRKLDGAYFRADKEVRCGEKVVLDVQGLCVPGKLENVSFQLREGEILAFCGLSDAGTHTVGQALFGVEPRSAGQVVVTAAGKNIRTPSEAMDCSVGYVPKDRDIEGLMLGNTIRDNFCLPAVGRLAQKLGHLAPPRLGAYAQRGVEEYGVKCTGVSQTINSLSGGNKQKINLGRWMSMNMSILLLDSPTRGVDVGVKAYIYRLMQEAKEKGVSIIMFSDELPEALGLADRILVMHDGKIKAEFTRDGNFSEECIIEVMI